MLMVAYIVLTLGAINLARMAFFLIGSDVYDIRANYKKSSNNNNFIKNPNRTIGSFYSDKGNELLIRPGFFIASSRVPKKTKPAPKTKIYKPLVTIIVPAHNEEKTLNRNLESIRNSSYKNIELIIVNDSSSDKTPQIARNFQRKYRNEFNRVVVLNVRVRGKARALNAGLKIAKGKLFMCLDADSALTHKSVEQGVSNFQDHKVVTLSSNVKIFKDKGWLNLFQRIEYMIGYQAKKAESNYNTQYIVGGIGSMFRTRLVKKLGGYDTDTITEDIDLSMKIIGKFGDSVKISYDPRMIVFTEAVIDIKGLLQQRWRWKYGRYQVFLKQKKLFWSRASNQNPILTWGYLPFALFSELTYSIEPITVGFILFLIFAYGNATLMISSFLTYLFYTIVQITGASSGYSQKERLKFVVFSPLAYFGMYTLSFVDYVATMRGLLNSRKLVKEYLEGGGNCDWKHVERAGIAIVKA